jgi:CRISPR-associated protein Csd1
MLSGNAGRVVVRSWLREPLDEAVEHFAEWFRDLEIVQFYVANEADEEATSSPYSLFRLAAAGVRDGKELKHKGELIGQLYRAALEGLSPPIALLKPVLDELTSALVKQDPMRPWSNPSRFALIKLILKRHPRKEFVPMSHLADTSDAAYNLGRLFAILSRLQDAAHEYQLKGAGVIERYYSGASTAPATVFGLLLRLHNHHLRKLEQQGDRGARAASAIRGKIAEVIGKFAADHGQPPAFPRILTLEQQGRFALGFYQQEAAERQAIDDAKERKAATEPKTS